MLTVWHVICMHMMVGETVTMQNRNKYTFSFITRNSMDELIHELFH